MTEATKDTKDTKDAPTEAITDPDHPDYDVDKDPNKDFESNYDPEAVYPPEDDPLKEEKEKVIEDERLKRTIITEQGMLGQTAPQPKDNPNLPDGVTEFRNPIAATLTDDQPSSEPLEDEDLSSPKDAGQKTKDDAAKVDAENKAAASSSSSSSK